MFIRITFNFKFSIVSRLPFVVLKKSGSKRKKTYIPFFLEFIEREMKHVRRRCRQSTCDNYMTACRSFSAFLGGADIPLRDVTAQLVLRYSRWLAARGVSINTSSCYMRSLRAMYNVAVKKYRLKQNSPFSAVFTGNAATRKRALGEQEIRRIGSASLVSGTFEAWTRDVFMFCFYAMGMPFADAVMLRKGQVKDGTIVYSRCKTGRKVTVGIEPCMEKIMRKYSGDDSEYVFPVPVGSRLPGGKGYAQLLKRYNAGLKHLSHEADICVPLTSYVPRHTWASLAYSRNVPINVISQALGHSSQRATMTYIKELDGSVIRRANKKIIKGF